MLTLNDVMLSTSGAAKLLLGASKTEECKVVQVYMY